MVEDRYPLAGHERHISHGHLISRVRTEAGPFGSSQLHSDVDFYAGLNGLTFRMPGCHCAGVESGAGIRET